MRWIVTTVIAAAVGTGWALPAAAEIGEVNLYSYRQPFLIQPLLDEFTKRSGIKVNVVYAQKGILERLKAEGPNSPADAVLTVDVGRLKDMVGADLLQPVKSDILEKNIPPQYRHPDGLWFGLTTRARVIFASSERTDAGEVTTYEDLTDAELKGRVCSRSGKHVYNISLVASLIAHEGEAAARDWLAALKSNLARKPQGNDRAQAKAIKEGLCDYAVANTYYMGKMATNEENPEQKDWAKAVRIIFPNQESRGTHVNISGAGVTRSSSNRAEAIQLIEFLSGDHAQKIYAEQNFEYPVKPGVAFHPMVASWGAFKADTIDLAKLAEYRAMASRLVDQTGFDQ